MVKIRIQLPIVMRKNCIAKHHRSMSWMLVELIARKSALRTHYVQVTTNVFFNDGPSLMVKWYFKVIIGKKKSTLKAMKFWRITPMEPVSTNYFPLAMKACKRSTTNIKNRLSIWKIMKRSWMMSWCRILQGSTNLIYQESFKLFRKHTLCRIQYAAYQMIIFLLHHELDWPKTPFWNQWIWISWEEHFHWPMTTRREIIISYRKNSINYLWLFLTVESL